MSIIFVRRYNFSWNDNLKIPCKQHLSSVFCIVWKLIYHLKLVFPWLSPFSALYRDTFKKIIYQFFNEKIIILHQVNRCVITSGDNSQIFKLQVQWIHHTLTKIWCLHFSSYFYRPMFPLVTDNGLSLCALDSLDYCMTICHPIVTCLKYRRTCFEMPLVGEWQTGHFRQVAIYSRFQINEEETLQYIHFQT